MVEGEQAGKYSRVSIVEELVDLGLKIQLEASDSFRLQGPAKIHSRRN